MADPLYPRPGLVLAQDGRLVVLGPPAGPAGASTLDLPDGSTWQVDHVDPSIAVALEDSIGDLTRSPLLVAAFGGDGALFLADRAVPMGLGLESEQENLAEMRPGLHRYGRPVHRLHDRSARQAGHLLVLADAGTDHRLHPLARVAASMEFALSVSASRIAEVLAPLSPHMMSVAERLSVGVDDDELYSLQRETAAGLRSLCARARKLRPGAVGIAHLADRLDHVVEADSDLAVASFMSAPYDLDLEADRDGDEEIAAVVTHAPPAPPTEPVELRRIEAGLVRVEVSRSTSTRWVRALHRRGLVLLGQAPLGRDGLVDVAEVVVPAGVTDDEIRIQVADLEDLAVPARGPADAIRTAVAAGREAARSDRLGDYGAARRRWIRCGDLWVRAGDMDRSEQARVLAEGASFGPASLPSLADEVAEALPVAY